MKGSVLLPTHFTTESDANKKGQKFGDLVRTYAAKGSKVTHDLLTEDVKPEAENFGYGTQFSVTGDTHPLFNGDTLNMTDAEINTLEDRLNTAQDNGNILHEMAFSIRGLLVGFVDVCRQSQQQEVKTQKNAQTLNGSGGLIVIKFKPSSRQSGPHVSSTRFLFVN